MATVYIFASSLFISILMLLLKAIELKYEKRNIFLDLLSKFDHKIEKLVTDLKFRSFQIIQIVRFIILVKLKETFYNTFHKIIFRLISQYKESQEKIMGHKEILNKGAVSFYLKKIAEEKTSGERGQITEM